MKTFTLDDNGLMLVCSATNAGDKASASIMINITGILKFHNYFFTHALKNMLLHKYKSNIILKPKNKYFQDSTNNICTE